MKSKICTTIDQCKKLLDLGIDINTADLTVTNYPLQDGSRFDFICCKLPNDTFPSITDGKSEKIPAWSLAALLELIPNWTMDKTDKVNLTCNPYYHCESCYEDIVDAAFEMVVRLKENKII